MFSIKTTKNKMTHAGLAFDVVIIGLGVTGLSCVRYFCKHGVNIAITDSRHQPPYLSALQGEFPDVPIYYGGINADLLLSAGQIVLSPGVSLQHTSVQLALAQGISVCSDIELFLQQIDTPIVAISGSNGKSTVTTLCAEMVQKSGIKTRVGGNIGIPVLSLLDGDVPELYVLELSSFQLEATWSLNAKASVVLNVSPDHMDRYNTLSAYAAAKSRIYQGDGSMVINLDDVFVRNMADSSRKQICFSLAKPKRDHFGIIDDDGVWLCQGHEKIIRAEELQIKGRHNIANALAAMALASTVQTPHAAMAETLREFSGLKHRCEQVATVAGVRWYNDSKATNVGACLASIDGLASLGTIVLIAGGDGKGADFSLLAKIKKSHVRHVLLFGVDADKIAAVISGHIPVTCVRDMDDAVQTASQIAHCGDVVLLAPACASFDMYADYQQRGDAFIKAVSILERA